MVKLYELVKVRGNIQIARLIFGLFGRLILRQLVYRVARKSHPRIVVTVCIVEII